MMMALEFGYKAKEKGKSIREAKLNFLDILEGKNEY